MPLTHLLVEATHDGVPSLAGGCPPWGRLVQGRGQQVRLLQEDFHHISVCQAGVQQEMKVGMESVCWAAWVLGRHGLQLQQRLGGFIGAGGSGSRPCYAD